MNFVYHLSFLARLLRRWAGHTISCHNLRGGLWCAIVLAQACNPTADATREIDTRLDVGPALVLLDSIPLQENDSSFLGRGGGLAIARDGDLLVADAFSSNILDFKRSGALRRIFGRAGSGPGEFQAPRGMAFLDDSTLAVLDVYGNSISLFDWRSGDYVRRRSFEGSFRSVTEDGSGLLIGLLNAKRGTSVAIWDRSADSMSYLVPQPEEYRTGSLTFMIHGNVLPLRLGDSLLVGFGSRNELVVTSSRGQSISFVSMPSRRRRQIPSDIESRIRQAGTPDSAIKLTSMLHSMKQLESGEIVVLHVDMEKKGKVYVMDGLVSVISRDLTSACIDGAIRFAHDAQPWVAVKDDTLFALEQVITDEQRSETFVKLYYIDRSMCKWIPTTTKVGAFWQ